MQRKHYIRKKEEIGLHRSLRELCRTVSILSSSLLSLLLFAFSSLQTLLCNLPPRLQLHFAQPPLAPSL